MLPILFEGHGWRVYSYGTAILVGAVLGGWLAWRLRPRNLFNLHQFLAICLLTTVGAALGARLGSALEHGRLDGETIFQALRIWERGGLASIGVPLAVLPLLLAYCRWQRLKPLQVLDHLMPFTLFGAGFQRAFGCYLGGCCIGRPTDLPWGVTFPGHSGPVHPTQLYLALLLFALFAFLVKWRPTLPGGKLLASLGSYAGVNLLVGFLRAGSGDPVALGLPWQQLLYFAVTLLCAALAILRLLLLRLKAGLERTAR